MHWERKFLRYEWTNNNCWMNGLWWPYLKGRPINSWVHPKSFEMVWPRPCLLAVDAGGGWKVIQSRLVVFGSLPSKGWYAQDFVQECYRPQYLYKRADSEAKSIAPYLFTWVSDYRFFLPIVFKFLELLYSFKPKRKRKKFCATPLCL